VGKQRLEKGIAAYKAAHPNSTDSFSTTWLPFYLNADAPKQGVDKRQYYYSKFGEQRSRLIFDRLTTLGKEDGISFKFGGKTGNTRDSHRLIQLGKSKSPEMQNKIVEALFKAYFEEEQDITSRDVLLRAGVKAGLPDAEVKEWLKSDQGGAEVDQEVRQAQRRAISGVPNFTIQGRYELGGAQEPEAFVEIFEKIKAGESS
jgi:predicted DsbA family dithiol-disulfide isomerase